MSNSSYFLASFTHFKPNRNRIRTVTLRNSIKFSWRFPNSSLVNCMHDGHSLTKDQVVCGEDHKISVVIKEAFRKDAGFFYCRSKFGVFSPWLMLQVKGGYFGSDGQRLAPNSLNSNS